MPLRLRSAGGGSVQLNSPVALATDVSMEVPAYDGAKVLTDKTPGVVLQVVHAKIANPSGNSGSWFASTSTTAANSGFSATITPKFATSKLLVRLAGNLNITTPTAAGVGAQLWVYRDGVNIHSGGNANAGTFIYFNSPLDQYMSYSNESLVNANNTSATTFSLWVARWSSVETVRLGGHDGQTTFTIMEIAA